MRQVEVSRTIVFDAPPPGPLGFFEALIGDNLDIGRPANVEIIFARHIYRNTPGVFRTAIDRPAIGPNAQAASCSTSSTSTRGSSSTSRTAARSDRDGH